tara:strand:- start:49 stop:1494 length:1446 start_codon:yes stop_codon:yes gene_type:complete
MADQGLLAQSKPGANTNTLLYGAAADRSASCVLTIANDGTGSAYNVGLKDYDQKLAVGAGAKLHPGDIITGYKVTVNNTLSDANTLTQGNTIVSDDGEKSFVFESFVTPTVTTVFVKDFLLRATTLESITGTFTVGETITKGTGGDTTTAVVYDVDATIIRIGPSTINGSGAEFTDGDNITSSGGATATISTGGIATAVQTFCFSTTTAGGTYNAYVGGTIQTMQDRAYRFDVADSSMTGRDFKLSTDSPNGEWGIDNTAGNADDGTEYTTGKTTNGTAGSGGAYVQYDLSANSALAGFLYFYDGGTGTAGNAAYGGPNRAFTITSQYTYVDIMVYDVKGTWTNSSDTFTDSGTTYTVTAQDVQPYGYVRSYSGTALYVILGEGSGDFAGSDTFKDNPKLSSATRTTVTVSSVDVATTALADENYIVNGVANGNNEVDRITSLVIGPGERVIVNSTTANNSFSLIGFEDASTAFATRVFGL